MSFTAISARPCIREAIDRRCDGRGRTAVQLSKLADVIVLQRDCREPGIRSGRCPIWLVRKVETATARKSHRHCDPCCRAR